MKIPPKPVTLKNGMSVTLRSAKVEDSSRFLEHLITAHDESYRNLNSSGRYWERVTVSEEEKILKNLEAAANKFMLIAETDQKIIGGLGIFGNEREFNSHSAALGMSIQNSFCGIGLGSEMMSYGLESARSAGLHRLDLTVRTYNDSGIALYEKWGFKRIGLLKDMAFIDRSFVDEYYYELILSAPDA